MKTLWDVRRLLPVGALGLIAAMTPAIADEMVPFGASLQMSVTSIIENQDGSMEQVIEGTGTALHMGRVETGLSIHVAKASYDPVRHALVLPLSGEAVITAANGDTLNFDAEGQEIILLSPSGSPVFPLIVQVTLEASGGSGRFDNATGMVYFEGFDADYIWGACTGEISSVGSNQR